MPYCLVSFGSNLGDRRAVLADAAGRLAASDLVHQFRASRLFQTPPIGGPGGQEPFFNAVGAFQTDAPAGQILATLQQIEQELGRQRARRWDARSIDLDVVLHGDLMGGHTHLTVPHPRYTARRFVVQPACDVAAQWRDPRFGWTMAQLADHLQQGCASLALVGGDLATRQLLCERLQSQCAITAFAAPGPWRTMSVVGNAPLMRRAVDGDEGGQELPQQGPPIAAVAGQRWISAYVPPLPPKDSPAATAPGTPRLLARLQWTRPESRWPAPHQIWPRGGDWPEYRLEIDDLDWAVSELASAFESMRCDLHPVTEDGDWYRQ